MGFRENLLEKIQINHLADKVMRSIHPTDSSQRIDRDAMRQLLEKGSYTRQKERDLDLYLLNDRHVMVLDNELKIFNTTVEDVGLRKSPTVKEMISIRNAIKILNDKDVVVSRRAETVARIRAELIEDLDLSYEAADIESMAKDGLDALKNNYADGIVEILTLFAELLGYEKANKTFRASHHLIWGKTEKSPRRGLQFGPAVIYGLMHNSLKMVQTPINSTDKEGTQRFHQIVKGEVDPDLMNDAVIDALRKAVMAIPETKGTDN